MNSQNSMVPVIRTKWSGRSFHAVRVLKKKAAGEFFRYALYHSKIGLVGNSLGAVPEYTTKRK